MAKYRALIIAGGALFALARSAGAADLLPPPPALEPPPPAAYEFNGWYLRGDVGLGVNATAPNLAVSPDPLAAGIAGGTLDAAATNTFNNPTLSASGIFDLGFGYQFNSWFRTDFTEEYRGGASFQALEVLNEPNLVGGNTSVQQYADFYRANISSWVSLFNGYVDLGTWSGITPYVGAGVGFAYNTLSGFTDTGYAYTNGANSAVGGYANDAGKWNFAWALMAGLSFDVTQNLKLDLGYRYLDYGKFTSGKVNCLAETTPGFTTGCYSIYSKSDLSSNDFRIGLRWMIGEATPPAQLPLVRKY
jgi:opacity protein-like surface antigen